MCCDRGSLPFVHSDSVFELVLYASSGDRIIRYFDEEKSDVLCRCRMDLETYPGFQQRAEASLGGFYIGANVRQWIAAMIDLCF